MIDFYTEKNGKWADGEAQGHLHFKGREASSPDRFTVVVAERQPQGWAYLGVLELEGDWTTVCAKQVWSAYEQSGIRPKIKFYDDGEGGQVSGEAQGDLRFEEVEYFGAGHSFEVSERMAGGWEWLGEFTVAIGNPTEAQVIRAYQEACICVKFDEIRCYCLACEMADR